MLWISRAALEGEFTATRTAARAVHCSSGRCSSWGTSARTLSAQPTQGLLLHGAGAELAPERWPSDMQQNPRTHAWTVRVSRDLVTLSYTEKWAFLLHLEPSVREDFCFQSQSGRSFWLQSILGVAQCMSHVSCYQRFLFDRKKHEIVLKSLCGCCLSLTQCRFSPRPLWGALQSFLPFPGVESGRGSE